MSFDEEEEDGGDFKIKKSKASRMIKKMRQAPNAMSSLIEIVEVVSTGKITINFFAAIL